MPGTNDLIPFLDIANFTHINANRSVKFESLTTSGDFRIAKHDTNFVAKLIGKDDDAFALGDGPGNLAKSLTHEPSLHPHGSIPHLTLYLGLGNQSGHRVNDDDIDTARADKCLGDFQSLFAVVRLREEKAVQINSDGLGASRVDGMLGIDECGNSTGFLGFGNDVESESSFT